MQKLNPVKNRCKQRVEINGLTGLGNGSGASTNKGGSLGATGGGRAFSFELLPAELFTAAKVTKSASASQAEGGLAGVVSLETPRALFNLRATTPVNAVAASIRGAEFDFQESA